MPLILDTGPLLLGSLLATGTSIPNVETDIAKLEPQPGTWNREYRQGLQSLLRPESTGIEVMIPSWVLGELPGTVTRVLGWKTGDVKWKTFWLEVRPAFLDRCDIVPIDFHRFYDKTILPFFLEFGPADTSSLILGHTASDSRTVLMTHDRKLIARAYDFGVPAGDLDEVYSLLDVQR